MILPVFSAKKAFIVVKQVEKKKLQMPIDCKMP
jgi:hypothetical protein